MTFANQLCLLRDKLMVYRDTTFSSIEDFALILTPTGLTNSG